VLHPNFYFNKLIPHLGAILKHQNRIVVNLIFERIEEIVFNLDEESYDSINPPRIDLEEFNYFLRIYIDQKLRIPNREKRMRVYKVFHRLISLLKEEERFLILWRIQEYCPYVSLAAELILRWKQEFLSGITISKKSPFTSPKLLDLFITLLTGNEQSLINRLELMIAAFNFLQFVLTRCLIHTDLVHIWDNAHLMRIQDNILTPWKSMIQRNLDQENRIVHSPEKQQETLKAMAKKGLPPMSESQFENAQWRNINDLMLTRTHIDRIEEIILKKSLKNF